MAPNSTMQFVGEHRDKPPLPHPKKQGISTTLAQVLFIVSTQEFTSGLKLRAITHHGMVMFKLKVVQSLQNLLSSTKLGTNLFNLNCSMIDYMCCVFRPAFRC